MQRVGLVSDVDNVAALGRGAGVHPRHEHPVPGGAVGFLLGVEQSIAKRFGIYLKVDERVSAVIF